MPGSGQAFLFNQYMKKEKPPHRGRFQAQGGKTQEGASWSQLKPTTKSQGIKTIQNLENKLSKSEYKIRKKCFEDAYCFVKRVPSIGIIEVKKLSFTPCPREKISGLI